MCPKVKLTAIHQKHKKLGTISGNLLGITNALGKREATNFGVGLMNSKGQVKGENWSRNTNSRLPSAVNVTQSLSNRS